MFCRLIIIFVVHVLWSTIYIFMVHVLILFLKIEYVEQFTSLLCKLKFIIWIVGSKHRIFHNVVSMYKKMWINFKKYKTINNKICKMLPKLKDKRRQHLKNVAEVLTAMSNKRCKRVNGNVEKCCERPSFATFFKGCYFCNVF